MDYENNGRVPKGQRDDTLFRVKTILGGKDMTITTEHGELHITGMSINYIDKTISYQTEQGFTALTESWANFTQEQAEKYFGSKAKELF